MAPQRIEETVPNTLPDDFGEWDGGAAGATPPTTLPDDFEGFDSGPTPALEAPASKAVALPPTVTKTPDFPAMRSPAVKPAPVPTPAPAPAPVSRKAERAARHAQPVARAKAEEMPAPRAIRPVPVIAVPEATETGKSKKTMIMAGIGAAVLVIVLLAVLIPMMRPKPAANSNLVVVSHPAVTQAGTEAPLDQPVAAKPAAATPQQQQTVAAAATPAQTSQAPVQSDAMDRQLNAPSRISKDLKGSDKEAAPTSFAAGGLEGLGGSNAGVGAGMGSRTAPNVKFAQPKFVTISSGVAQGMLVQRTTPNYPSIAKTARVAGTVVLEATISKNGTIASVKAVSGPEMLRQAAVDAVRSWRYKPYLLDNQPIEMQTTVNVVFSLGGS
jgi:protein TonB